MTEQTDDVTVKNDVMKFACEYVVPGGANLAAGKLKIGALHTLVGFVAKRYLGLAGLIAVSANSIVKAKTGRNLHEVLGLCEDQKSGDEAKAAAPAKTQRKA